MATESTWASHGTKILGYIVIGLGAIGAAEVEIHKLLPDGGDLVFDILMKILNYVFVGAGAAVVFRGYQNTRRIEGENPPPPQE